MNSKVWLELGLDLRFEFRAICSLLRTIFELKCRFGVISPSALISTGNHPSFVSYSLSSNTPAHLCSFHVLKQRHPGRSLQLDWLADRSRSLHCHCTFQRRAHRSIESYPQRTIKISLWRWGKDQKIARDVGKPTGRSKCRRIGVNHRPGAYEASLVLCQCFIVLDGAIAA
jgi:hypothetical protein